MVERRRRNTDPSANELLRQLKEEFHAQQTTPLQDKKLTVPVALAFVIICTLVAATWKVANLYETAVSGRIQAGVRERNLLKKDIKTLQTSLDKHKKAYEDLKSSVEGNTEDLDDLWRLKDKN